jgi:hypothetical protein
MPSLRRFWSKWRMRWGIPAVPGYYMTTRMIQYAFNDVVADMSNPRETLYLK